MRKCFKWPKFPTKVRAVIIEVFKTISDGLVFSFEDGNTHIFLS